jgi:hypothetical protein
MAVMVIGLVVAALAIAGVGLYWWVNVVTID